MKVRSLIGKQLIRITPYPFHLVTTLIETAITRALTYSLTAMASITLLLLASCSDSSSTPQTNNLPDNTVGTAEIDDPNGAIANLVR